MTITNKQQLRAEALAARQRLSVAQRLLYSSKIIQRLQSYLREQEVPCESLLAYRSMPTEVNTDALFDSPEWTMFAPITHHHEHMEWRQVHRDTQWSRGVFGVLEPDGEVEWQAGAATTTLLCPLSAFDSMGNRLGMGKGCFDYWLASHRQHIQQVIGLAFSCQQVARIPAELHDVPMDMIITEQEIITCPKR